MSDKPKRLELQQSIARVHDLYQLTQTDLSPGRKAISAFDALLFVVGFCRFDSPEKESDPDWEPQDEAFVRVPWWIVDYLAQAWFVYRDVAEGKTFGEVLGIEGGGSGKHPAKNKWIKHNRDLLLALAVYRYRIEAAEGGNPVSLENTFVAVAEEKNMSEDIVRRAWKRHGGKLSKPLGA